MTDEEYAPTGDSIDRAPSDEGQTIRSKNLLASIFRDVPALITISEIETGRFVEVNEAFCKSTGYAREQAMGATSTELGFISPVDRQRLVEVIEAQGCARGMELELTRADGSRMFCLYYGEIIDTPQGKRLLSLATDITARRTTEQRLRQSEADFRDLVASVPGAVYQFVKKPDESFEVPFMSKGGIQLMGCSDEFLRDPANLFMNLHPDDVPRMWRSIEESANDLSPWACEFRVPSDTGETRWIRGASNPTKLDDGSIRWTGILEDISERKHTEEALRQSEAQKNLILNTTNEMVAYYDKDLRVIWANRAAAVSVGQTTEELVGRHCYEIWQKRSAPCPECPVLEACKTKQPVQSEQCSPDGRYWFLRGYPILDDKGEVVALVEYGQDISESKRLEAERAQLEAQYMQSQKMESVGRLAGGVAHDFNNMLNVILGNVELALEGAPADPALRECLMEIEKAARRSADLTGQLLAFARKQTVSPKTLDLNETVEDMLKMIERLIGENMRLVWRPGIDLKPIHIDPAQVSQVLVNLAVNARDAIENTGEIVIETAAVEFDRQDISAHPDATPGGYAMLAVSDTGKGMDEATREKIFEPFFTTKSIDRGTGLGLATVYGIVRQNKGFIQVYSEPGLGSTFRIYLPCAGDTPPQTAPTNDTYHTYQGSELILVVEDEEAILRLARSMLGKMGYRVLTASSPREALAIAQDAAIQIDLIVTDVVMPEMHGPELAERIGELQPQAKCLFISGYTASVMAHHGIIGQDIPFVHKPFTMKTIGQAVRSLLDSPA